MKIELISKLLTIVTLLIVSTEAMSATCVEKDVTINRIRAVGSFNQAPVHNNTVELHHLKKEWCGWEICKNKNSSVIDGKDSHLVSAAYLAFAANKTVDITIDDTLGTKRGICIVTYLDVNK